MKKGRKGAILKIFIRERVHRIVQKGEKKGGGGEQTDV